MRSRMFVGGLLMVSVLGAVTLATRGDSAPARQSAVVYLAEPTLIGSTIVQGPVLFIHDEAKMERGEPCTSVRLFEPGFGPKEEVAAFHCITTSRKMVGTFTLRTRPNTDLGVGCILTEYQFAGDNEGHRVPIQAHAH